MSQAQVMTDPDPDPSLGELIAEHRHRLGWTRVQLARAIGASVSSVKNWEADRARPHGARLAALGDALEVRFVRDDDGNFYADPEPPAPAPQPVVVNVIVVNDAASVDRIMRNLGLPTVADDE